MRRPAFLVLALLLPFAVATPAAAAPVADPAGTVDTLIGSANNGETFPGAVTPYGMVQWSPENTAGDQTRTVEPGGYGYANTRIRGFAMTHLSGTGCAGASGDIPFMPYPGTVSSSPSADNTDAIYASNFSHADETGDAGYYQVGLDSGVNVELTATQRTGTGRFTYPEGKPATMLVRTAHSELGSTAATTKIDPATRTISGSVTTGNFCGYIDEVGRRSYYTLHFVAQFDQGFTATGTWQDAAVSAGSTTSSGGTTWSNGWPVAKKGSGGYVTFDTSATRSIKVRVGISYVSEANARANLAAENPAGTLFDTVRQQAKAAWNTALERVQISGGTPAQHTTFYTALYHSLLHPNVFNDVNGQYMGPDQKVHSLSPGQQAQYANFSGWDVYRDQVQLVTLLQPDVGSDIAQSIYNHAVQNNGVWDRWTHNQGGTHVMTGDPGPAAVTSIHAFGGTNFDVTGAFNSMVRTATTPTALDLSRDGWNVMVVGQRPSLDKYLQLGYVPADGNAWGGAGETLEVGAADFGIAQLAGKLGDTTIRDQFVARAQGWKRLYNPANGGYIADRNADGSWVTGFTPGTDQGFAEGSSAMYTWMVPYNAKGLFTAMGGNAAAAARLDAMFRDGAGNWSFKGAGGVDADLTNEPSIGIPWLYNFAGQPYKAQQTVRQVVNTLWSATPGGIPGQDDLGAMSAWYVFAAMGMYPLTPGRAELLLTAPLFTQVVIKRSNGVTLTVNAPAAAANAGYVQSLTVDGNPSNRAWLPESFVTNGGTLDYVLGTSANTSWGAAAADAPPSWDVGGTPPSPNLALNKAATADSQCAGTEGPAKAVNGSVSGGTGDKWCSAGASKWLRVDLGSTQAVRSVTVKHASAGGESASYNTRDYDVQTSPDGVTWTTIVQQRGNTAGTSTHAVTASARHLRLAVLGGEQSGTGPARIYEFEVY